MVEGAAGNRLGPTAPLILLSSVLQSRWRSPSEPMRLSAFVCCLAAAVLLLSASSTRAVEVPITLNLAEVNPANPVFNRLDLSVSASFGITITRTDTTDLTGSVEALLDVTPLAEGVQVNGVRFTGGQVVASPVEFDFGLALIVGSGLGGEVMTSIAGFSPVNAGTFPTQDHEILIDQGTIVATGLVNETVVLTEADPVSFSDVGVGNLDVQQTDVQGRMFTFGVEVTLPVDATDMIDSPEATLGASGTIRAANEFSIFIPSPGDFDEDGKVDAVDYAVWREALEAGTMTSADYQTWRENYGQGQTSQASAAVAAISTPEPAVLWLLAAALGCWTAAGRCCGMGR